MEVREGAGRRPAGCVCGCWTSAHFPGAWWVCRGVGERCGTVLLGLVRDACVGHFRGVGADVDEGRRFRCGDHFF